MLSLSRIAECPANSNTNVGHDNALVSELTALPLAQLKALAYDTIVDEVGAEPRFNGPAVWERINRATEAGRAQMINAILMSADERKAAQAELSSLIQVAMTRLLRITVFTAEEIALFDHLVHIILVCDTTEELAAALWGRP